MNGYKKAAMTVEIREGVRTEYGTPTPVVVVDLDDAMPGREQTAFMFRLAAEVELLSLTEQWGVIPGRFSLMGKGNPCRALLKLELGEGTMAEAKRGAAVLRRAVGNMTRGSK